MNYELQYPTMGFFFFFCTTPEKAPFCWVEERSKRGVFQNACVPKRKTHGRHMARRNEGFVLIRLDPTVARRRRASCGPVSYDLLR